MIKNKMYVEQVPTTKSPGKYIDENLSWKFCMTRKKKKKNGERLPLPLNAMENFSRLDGFVCFQLICSTSFEVCCRNRRDSFMT